MTSRAKFLSGIAVTALALGTVTAGHAQTKTATTPTRTATSTTTATAKPVKPTYYNVRSFYYNVRSFWNEVNPFYYNVRSFWGNVDPFYYNVRSFWGATDPVLTASAANAPAYATIGAHWEQLGGEWRATGDRWQVAGDYTAQSARSYADLATEIRAMVSKSEAFWGSAVAKQTGRTFNAGFADKFMADHGIDLNDPESLARMSANGRAGFFLDWYDGLMRFSGTDHVDWWMKSANWSPKLTQLNGGGAGAVIGLVDAFDVKSDDIKKSVAVLSRQTSSTGGHGEGVLGLIYAPHDGKGVMGIAPNARVAAYNPFIDGATDWAGVEAGVLAVIQHGATVVNLSLGEPGSTFSGAWRDLFRRSSINTHKDTMLFVIAAGNEGIVGSGNVNMDGALDNTFIVVGAGSPDGKAAEWSNKPGNLCLTLGAGCLKSTSLKDSGYLMHRFITAPGEMILVSDGLGGLTRQSGTSLAAPMVSGTVALIQGRWPWLRYKPRDVAHIILQSARDVGAPGVDAEYGVGMLDVEAAMSPLDFNKLQYTLNSGGRRSSYSATTLRSSKVQSSWEASGAYFHAHETLPEMYRDFQIPLSSRLHGKMVGTQYFQDYVFGRMTNWMNGGTASGRNLGVAGFADGTRTGMIGADDGWRMSMTGRTAYVPTGRGGDRRVELRTTMDVEAPSGGFGFSVGRGDGAVSLGGSASLGLASDFDPYSGGTNPLLGFASGGAHMAARADVAPGLRVKFGLTEQQRAVGVDLFEVNDPNDRYLLAGLERYRSNAANFEVEYRPANAVTLTAAYTRLAEPNAILGVRSLARAELGDGTVTDGVTLGASVDTGLGITMFGSATGARSRSASSDAALRIGDGGMLGTSFQLGVAAQDVLGGNDRLRFSLAQPLHTEAGSIEVTGLQVIDRQTGERAIRTDRFDIAGGGTRRLVAEGLYGAPVLSGRGELSLFGRSELRAGDEGTPRLMIGTQLKLGW